MHMKVFYLSQNTIRVSDTSPTLENHKVRPAPSPLAVSRLALTHVGLLSQQSCAAFMPPFPLLLVLFLTFVSPLRNYVPYFHVLRSRAPLRRCLAPAHIDAVTRLVPLTF